MIKSAPLSVHVHVKDQDTTEPEIRALHSRIQALKQKVGLVQSYDKLPLTVPQNKEKNILKQRTGQFGQSNLLDVQQAVALSKTQSKTSSAKPFLTLADIGIALTTVWLVFSIGFVVSTYGLAGLSTLGPIEWGAISAVILAPTALLWVVVANWQRGRDVQQYAHLLRQELHTILFPAGEDPAQIRRDVELLCRQSSDLTRSSQSVMQSIQAARQALQLDMQAFSGATRKSEEVMDRLTQVLNEKSDHVLRLTDNLETRIERIERRLSQATAGWEDTGKNLEALLEGGAGQIVAAGQSVHAEITKAQLKLEETSLTINNVGKKASHHIMGVVTDMSRKIGDMNAFAREAQIKSLDACAVLDQKAARLEDVTGRLDRILSQDVFEVPVTQFDQMVAVVEERQSRMVTALDTRLSGLTAAHDKISGAVEHTLQTLKGQSTDLSALSGQMMGQTAALTKELSVQKTHLSESVVHLFTGMKKISETLDQKFKDFDVLSSKSQSIISDLKSNIYVDVQDLEDISSASIAALRNLGDQVHAEVVRFDDVSDSLEAKVKETSQSIEAHFQKISPECTQYVTQLEDLEERFIHVSGDVRKVSAEGIESVQAWNDNLDAYILKFDGATLHITEAQQKLKDQVQDLSLTSDRVGYKIESVQKSLEIQNNDLSASVAAAVTVLEGAAHEFETAARKTAEMSQDVVGKMTDSVTQAEFQTERLEKAVAQTMTKTRDFVGDIVEQSMHILTQTQESVAELALSRIQLEDAYKDVDTQLTHIVEKTGLCGQELKSHAMLVAKTALESSEGIISAGKILRTEVGRMGMQVEDAGLKISQAQNGLGGEVENMIKISSHLIDISRKSTSCVADKVGELEGAAVSIRQALDAIQNTKLKAERDSFMEASGYVLESLYSMTVDLTRAIDGEVSEKMWRSYQKGDVTVFIRRLMALKESVSMDDMEAKYLRDQEFRTYAQRYMGQFEKIYREASSHESRRSIFLQMIASSDVAKLYELLCLASRHKDIMRA